MASRDDLDPRLVAQIAKVTGKRPKTVIDHILKHGQISTEELKDTYGYNHPPRAIRDVRENGVPLETFRVRGSDGRMIAAYRFGDPSKIENHKLGGRKTFSKHFSKALIASHSGKCALCGERYSERMLQTDHRIPYEVAGEHGHVGDETEPVLFMPVCGTCNRKKSWSCEHCDNWTGAKDPTVCASCYWASPENSTHVAMRAIRRLELTWSDTDIRDYTKLKKMADKRGISMQELVRRIINDVIQ